MHKYCSIFQWPFHKLSDFSEQSSHDVKIEKYHLLTVSLHDALRKPEREASDYESSIKDETAELVEMRGGYPKPEACTHMFRTAVEFLFWIRAGSASTDIITPQDSD